jgi:hypothetical protein
VRVHAKVLVILAVLSAAGCSAAHPAAEAKTTVHRAATPSASPSPTVPQFSGPQLAPALLPASYFPAGYTSYRSGNSGPIDLSPGQYALAGLSCSQVYAYESAASPNLGQSAFAWTENDDSVGQAYYQEINQYPSASLAGSFFSSLRQTLGGCGSFTSDNPAPSDGTVQLKVTAAPDVAGHPAFGLYQQVTRQVSAGTAADISSWIIVLDGTDVYEVDAYAGTIGGVRQPPTGLSLPAIAERLIAGVAKL